MDDKDPRFMEMDDVEARPEEKAKQQQLANQAAGSEDERFSDETTHIGKKKQSSEAGIEGVEGTGDDSAVIDN